MNNEALDAEAALLGSIPSERLGRATAPSSRLHGKLSLALRLVVAMIGIALLATLYFIVCLFLLPWRVLRIRLGNATGAAVGRWIYRAGGLSHELFGRSPESLAPAIFVQNHTGTLDLFLAMQLCPAPGSGAMKRGLLRVPFLGLGYLLSGHLLIDRGNRKQAIRAMAATAKLVESDRISIWILPEGSRSRDGRLRPFKKGFGHLALATRLPIVPVVVHEAHRYWSHGLRVRPGRVAVEVLPPIPTVDWTRETLDERIAEVERLFIAALSPDQRPAS